MQSTWTRLRSKLTWLHVIVMCATCVAILYVSLFLLTRYHYNATRGIFYEGKVIGCPKNLNVYFFSKNPRTNQTLFYFFYPIHRWALAAHSDDEDFENNCEITSVYLFSEENMKVRPDFWD